jgi:hypothetical protein
MCVCVCVCVCTCPLDGVPTAAAGAQLSRRLSTLAAHTLNGPAVIPCTSLTCLPACSKTRHRFWFENPAVSRPIREDVGAAAAGDQRLFPRECREAVRWLPCSSDLLPLLLLLLLAAHLVVPCAHALCCCWERDEETHVSF